MDLEEQKWGEDREMHYPIFVTLGTKTKKSYGSSIGYENRVVETYSQSTMDLIKRDGGFIIKEREYHAISWNISFSPT